MFFPAVSRSVLIFAADDHIIKLSRGAGTALLLSAIRRI
jgi:hypothetical protein